MNFLAHIYLSGENDLIKIGNLMADGIRGKQFETYPLDIQKGIFLHRGIDTFTDAHPVFRQSTKRLHAKYHHYAGVIVDVFYDHFLAKNWTQFSEEPLIEYVNRFYTSLDENYDSLSPKMVIMMPYMIEQNWLVSYQSIEGIHQILTQMDSRTKNESKMRFASADLTELYSEFECDFNLFFGDLQDYSTQKLSSL